MINKSCIVIIISLLSLSLFAQNEIPAKHQQVVGGGEKEQSELPTEIKTVQKDSSWQDVETIDGLSLRDHKLSFRIDSLWIKELTNSDLYPRIQEAVLEIPYSTEEVSVADYEELTTETLKERLAELNKHTPFQIEYSPELEKVIRRYLGQSKRSFERVMSLSYYYFPLFEKEFDRYNIPMELKYLSIVESALNPRARSRAGATGIWQFMYETGKVHGLEVNSYVDERMNPEKATQAAAEYLSRLYKIFGDWNLVLASYNAGPGNVTKAIRRSGGESDYWKIKSYMPRETANYVPAFLATYYIFHYAEEHGFNPYLPEVVRFETDTIKIKKPIKFEHIAEITGVDEDLIGFLNPQYKLNIIPVIKGKDHYLRLPVRETGIFAANEEAIYSHSEELLAGENLTRYEMNQYRLSYRVKSGDYLGKIAQQYGVSVREIKEWNRLPNNNLRIGQNLMIYPKEPKIASTKTSSPASQASVNESAGDYYVVKSGDSLWSIAHKLKGVTVNQIKNWNGISSNHLKPGMKLRISGS